MTTENEVPKSFLVISIAAVLWNLLGLMAFVSHIMMTPETFSELPQAEQALYSNMPFWATLSFAIAVIAGTFGSLALVMKKSMAKPLFVASLAAALLQNFHAFVINDSFAVYGSAGLILPGLVIAIAIMLIIFTDKANKKAWLS